MATSGPSQLFTCRYWAFGPGCPNHDEGGVNFCTFAHWDTGRLASSFDQRGTCKYWLRGYCGRGNRCWYEHRNTGVNSMYQGPLVLVGLDREIANAAAKAGFNMWNHEALFELIWSVKRVALRHCRPEANRLRPRDPVYPDRFRPSGLGDNSNKKRKQTDPEPKSETPIRLGDYIVGAPKTATRAFRYRNVKREMRPRSRPLTSGWTAGNAGTSDDATDVNSVVENDRSKRQRLNNGESSSLRPTANQSRMRAEAVTFRASTTGPIMPNTRSEGNAGRMSSGGSFTQQHDFVSFSQTSISTNAVEPRRTTSQTVKELADTPLNSLSNALLMVPKKMRQIAELTEDCRESMRVAFEDNKGLLDCGNIGRDMQALGDHFNTIGSEIKMAKDCFLHAQNSIRRSQCTGVGGDSSLVQIG